MAAWEWQLEMICKTFKRRLLNVRLMNRHNYQKGDQKKLVVPTFIRHGSIGGLCHLQREETTDRMLPSCGNLGQSVRMANAGH